MSSNPVISGKPDPFDSSLHRINAAKASIADIESGLQEFRTGNSLDVVQRFDPDVGKNVLYVRFSHHTSTAIRHKASTALADLRSALDDALCEGAMQLGRPNSNGVYFPVCQGANAFEREIKRKCRGVDAALLDFIRALEPYQHGKGEILWAISRFAGKAKHGPVLPLTPSVTKVILPSKGPFEIFRPTAYPNATNEIAVATGTSTDPDQKIGVTYDIVINSEQAGFSFNGNAHFSDVIGIIESVVLGLKAETERALRTRS